MYLSDIKVEDESGIDGILKRLEKERSISYTATSKDNELRSSGMFLYGGREIISFRLIY